MPYRKAIRGVVRGIVGARLFLAGVLLAVFSPAESRAQQPVVLDGQTQEYALGDHLELLKDEHREWTIDQVASPPYGWRFESARISVPAFGYSTAAYWLRFTVVQPEDVDQRWFLEVSNKSLDDVTLYVPDRRGGFTLRHTGDALPFDTREIKDRNFVFSLPATSTPEMYYLRVASKGPVHVPMRILSMPAYLQQARSTQFFLGLFFGTLLVMAVYHLLLYLSIKDSAYLYYVLFIAYLLLYEISVERIGFEYLWSDNLWWAERANSTLALLCAIVGIQFTRSFLRSRAYAPRWDLGLVVLMVVSVVLIGVNLAGMRAWVNVGTLVFVGIASVSSLATAAVCLKRGGQAARYYLIAWSFLIGGILLTLLGYFKLIPPSSFLSTRGIQLGAALEVSFFALALGYRYNVMQKERERLRHRIASDLHDDIGSGLTQISLHSELLRRAAGPAAAELADQIGTQARTLALTMRDIVWAIEPRQDSWEALELRMKDYASSLLGPAGIALDMRGELLHDPKTLPVELRQNLLMLFKEVVHNAVKHAHCTAFTVRWRLDRKALWMQFRDDGCGFDPEKVRAGSGLYNIRRRATDLKGTFLLEAAPGAPTVIEVEVPLVTEGQYHLSG